MLEGNDKSLQSLSHDDHPLPRLRDTITGVLSTDEQKHGSNLRIEVVVDYIIPLAELLGAAVIIVIDQLIEP